MKVLWTKNAELDADADAFLRDLSMYADPDYWANYFHEDNVSEIQKTRALDAAKALLRALENVGILEPER